MLEKPLTGVGEEKQAKQGEGVSQDVCCSMPTDLR